MGILVKWGQSHKEHVIKMISEELKSYDGNPYIYIRQLLAIADFFNWRDELASELDFLHKKINEETSQKICPECDRKEYTYQEGVFICRACGYSHEG